MSEEVQERIEAPCGCYQAKVIGGVCSGILLWNMCADHEAQALGSTLHGEGGEYPGFVSTIWDGIAGVQAFAAWVRA